MKVAIFFPLSKLATCASRLNCVLKFRGGLLQVEEAAQSVAQSESSSSQSSKDGSGSSGRGPAAIASGMMMKFLGNGSA